MLGSSPALPLVLTRTSVNLNGGVVVLLPDLSAKDALLFRLKELLTRFLGLEDNTDVNVLVLNKTSLTTTLAVETLLSVGLLAHPDLVNVEIVGVEIKTLGLVQAAEQHLLNVTRDTLGAEMALIDGLLKIHVA